MKVIFFLTFCCWVSLVKASGDEAAVTLAEVPQDATPAATEAPRNGTGTPGEPSAVTAEETVPDDILNWFFYHSFKKLDEFFQSEQDKESQRDASDDLNTTSNNWKTRASKVILKLILIILALVSSTLFVFGVFILMLVAFLVCKFLSHLFQCFQERKKQLKNNSTRYQVNV